MMLVVQYKYWYRKSGYTVLERDNATTGLGYYKKSETLIKQSKRRHNKIVDE